MELIKECDDILSVCPELPFSWSYFRHTLFNQCKRAYFYHYYGAQNGWDQYSSSSSQHIHKLKNIKSTDLWVEDIFIRSIRELFIAPRKYMTEKELIKLLKNKIRINLNRENHQCISHEWDSDHKKLNLYEDYYNRSSNLKQYAADKLNDVVEKFTSCDIFYELCKVKYYQWKTYTPPIYAYIDRKKIWASPALIWRNGTNYNVLNLRLTAPSTDFPISLGISAIYLAQRAHINYDNVISRKIFIHDSIELFTGQCDIHSLTNLIKTSSDEMLKFVTSSGYTYESDFEKSVDKLKCNRCNFKEICNI